MGKYVKHRGGKEPAISHDASEHHDEIREDEGWGGGGPSQLKHTAFTCDTFLTDNRREIDMDSQGLFMDDGKHTNSLPQPRGRGGSSVGVLGTG